MSLTENQNFQALINECESDVRSGQVPKARTKLLQMKFNQLPRDLALPFANICRRVGLTTLGLRILSPIVNGDRKVIFKPPTSPELAEFAVLLQRCGAVEEALGILEKLDGNGLPEARLYKVFCLFNCWEYFKAVEEIRLYLGFDLAPYARMVGRVNLAAALIATDQYQEAIDQLNEDIEIAHRSGHRRLEGNCYELRGQAQILVGKFNKANADLSHANHILFGEMTSGEISIQKWLAVIEATKVGSAEPLRAFRQLALERKDFEGVRHADFHELRVEFDEKLFHHLLFGSPWPAYRERVQRSLGHVLVESEFMHDFTCFGGKSSDNSNIFDLQTGLLSEGGLVPLGGTIHRCLNTFLLDFYRPIRVGGVFAKMFPGEKFDIFSSPNRIHQVIFRVREWIQQEKLPLSIAEERGGFSLNILDAFRFRVPYERRSVDPNLVLFNQVLTKFGDGILFSARELAKEFDISPLVARRFCLWAVDSGRFDKVGAGPATKYGISNATQRIRAV